MTSRDAILKEFAEAVHMKPAAPEKHLATEESRSVGYVHEGEGESEGHQEGRRILKIKRKVVACTATSPKGTRRRTGSTPGGGTPS